MTIVGITGSIGSGKSEVAKVFAEKDAWVIDADEEAKALLKKGEAGYEAVIHMFGKDVLKEGGEIDKKRLAALVFKDIESVRKVNALIHPLVHQRVVEKLREIDKTHQDALVIIDAPLLIEAGFHKLVNFLIVVKPGSRVKALERAAKRLGITMEEAERRLTFQIPQEEKERLADVVIVNDGTLGALRQKALQVYERIINKEERIKA